jgi:hypothetical protein
MRYVPLSLFCVALSGCVSHPPHQETWSCTYQDIKHTGYPSENNRFEINGNELIEHKTEAWTKNPYTVSFGISENTPLVLVASRTIFSTPLPAPEVIIIDRTTNRFRMFDLGESKTGILPSVGACIQE